MPAISIPLYTLTSKNVSLPISLSYHASGIRVDEDASWVGLGWSLNSGGVISRTVRGVPDDQSLGYFSTRTLVPHPLNEYYADAHYATYYQEALGAVDTQPDIYMFSAMGHSFKFFIDSNYNVQTIPKSAVNITHATSLAGGPFGSNDTWIAKLEDGTTLYFG